MVVKSPSTPPREHFESEVQPPVNQFLSDPTVEWKAKCAAVALTSVIEWTHQYLQAQKSIEKNVKVGDFRAQLIRQCDAIQPVMDVADAMRHRFLDRPSLGRIVTTSTDAWSCDQKSLLLDAPGTAYHKRPFDEVVREVVKFWDCWIAKNT